MLKAAYPFQITDSAFELHRDVNALEQALQAQAHRPIGSTEHASIGFIPPLGQEGAPLVHAVGGYALFSVFIEQKRVPSDALRHELEQRVREIEKTEERKVGRKEQRELKEEIEYTLLPKVLPKRRQVFGYFSPQGRLVIEAGSDKLAGEVATLLRESCGSLPIVGWTVVPEAEIPVGVLMTGWLCGEQPPPKDIAIGEEAVLVGDEGETARFSRHDLEGDEIRLHLESGKQVTRLGLRFGDRLNFTLDQRGALLKIRESDVLAEQIDADAGDGDATNRFSSEFLVKAREIDALIQTIKHAA